MAGPFQIDVASPGLWSANIPAAGPFYYGGNLFALAFQNDFFLRLFKSSDGGETWAQVGSDVEVYSATAFGSCIDVDYPATPKAYVAYVGTDLFVYVRPVDFSLEDFGAESSAGPEIEAGVEPVASLLIEQSTDGEFGLLHIIEDQDASDVRRTSISLLDATLSAWDGPTDIDTNGTTDGDAMAPIGIARGAGGRIHGFVNERVSGSESTYHTLVRESGGGIGGELDLIESDGQTIGSATFFGSDIGLLYFTVGGAMRSAIAASADNPAFTLATVEAAGTGGFVMLAGDGGFEAIYDAGGVLRARWDGAAWGTPDSIGVSSPAFFFSARLLDDSALIYSTDGSDLWFIAIDVPPGGLVLTGETIPTGEFFFPTDGITGGGSPENCGPVTPEPPEPGCNPNPGGPLPPHQRDTCPIGAGFSF